MHQSYSRRTWPSFQDHWGHETRVNRCWAGPPQGQLPARKAGRRRSGKHMRRSPARPTGLRGHESSPHTFQAAQEVWAGRGGVSPRVPGHSRAPAGVRRRRILASGTSVPRKEIKLCRGEKRAQPLGGRWEPGGSAPWAQDNLPGGRLEPAGPRGSPAFPAGLRRPSTAAQASPPPCLASCLQTSL